MGSLKPINLQTAIGDLPLHDCQVGSETMGQVVANQFAQRPTLIGVVVVDENQLVGLISRSLFEQIQRNQAQYHQFLNHSLRQFLQGYQPQSVMVMGPQEQIDRAVKNVLNRPQQIWHEPIVVVFADENLPGFKDFLLLDVNLLLRAQYQRNQLLQRTLTDQAQEKSDWLHRLAEKTAETKHYGKALKEYKKIVSQKNNQIEFLQTELLIRQEQIDLLKQEIIALQSLVGMEIDRACEFTHVGVENICNSTGKIVQIGHLLKDDLNSICSISELIGELSNQFRHLAVQAAIITNNNPHIHLHGFSKISSEIGKLVVQTLDIGRQADRMAYNFRSRIDELTTSAEDSTKIAYSLIERMGEMGQVFHDQLGDNAPNAPHKHPSSSASNNKAPEQSPLVKNSSFAPINSHQASNQALVNKISVAKQNLAALQTMVKYNESSPLVSKIKRALDHQKHSQSMNLSHD